MSDRIFKAGEKIRSRDEYNAVPVGSILMADGQFTTIEKIQNVNTGNCYWRTSDGITYTPKEIWSERRIVYVPPLPVQNIPTEIADFAHFMGVSLEETPNKENEIETLSRRVAELERIVARLVDKASNVFSPMAMRW